MTDNSKVMENPYLSARREYGDRYSSAVKDATRWRQISLLMVLLCLAFGATMMWLASQNKVAPYVVHVDEHNYAIAVKPAEDGSIADTRAIAAALGRFFINFKTITADITSQRRLIEDAYAYLEPNSSAANTVTQYYKEHSPFVAAQNKREPTVQVKIRSLLPSGNNDRSWQVLWTEEKMEQGTVTEKTDWRAIVTLNVFPVRELQEVLKNPFGILINEINIAQDIN